MLKVREDHVSSVLDDARKRLGEVTKNESEYKAVLSKLIVQGLYQVMEPKVILRCRQVDVPLVQDVIPTSAEQYKAAMKQDVELIIDEKDYLAADTCGGVELFALNGRIKVRSKSLVDISSLSLYYFFVGAKYSGVQIRIDFAATCARDP